VPPADSPALADVRDAIARAGGAIGVDEYLAIALYGEHGFYARAAGERGGSAGRRGDFLTSPEVGPLFGAVVARFLDAEWERLGRPDPFTVVDAGAGPGTLARAVQVARPACREAMRYVAVEISEAQRSLHPDGVHSTSAMPEQPFVGVVVANELLDNLPFRLAVFDGGWREAYVVVGADGSLAEVLSAPFDPPPAGLPARPPHGARAPIHDAAAAWVDDARRLVAAGSVVVVDYVTSTTAQLATRPYREWLRTYRRHERGGHYLADPGGQDVTIQVPLDQLTPPDAAGTQAQWLRRWGIDDLVDEGRRVWTEQASRPGLDALRMRSRISEAEALLDPDGLGAFTVLEWRASPSGRRSERRGRDA
jgi:SAM-dependent MidA family methyltransferase